MDIEFRDVTFCYPGSRTPALSHVSMHLRPGEKIAVGGKKRQRKDYDDQAAVPSVGSSERADLRMEKISRVSI